VYLTVNAGEVPSVMVPDLNGLSVRQAKNRITSLQLQVGAVQADPIPAPYPNTITKQEPTPGDSLKQGEPVDLWYSTGRGTEEVTVPRVVGQTVAAARDQLLNQKLRFVMVSEGDATTEDEGTEGASSSEPNLNALYVQRQEPSSGATVRAGREIRLITTSDSTTVPSPPSPSADTTVSDTSGLGF
jgi:beta-lactam-binding protein with PASTA domain